MKTIVIKIGGDFMKDLDILSDPKNVDSFPDKVIYLKNFDQVSGLLSGKKLELIKYLLDAKDQSVTSIALGLERKKEAISRDLHQLEVIGLVQMEKRGKSVYPRVAYNSIQIDMCSQA